MLSHRQVLVHRKKQTLLSCNMQHWSLKLERMHIYHDPRHRCNGLALRRLTDLSWSSDNHAYGNRCDNRRKILLKPIYVSLGTSNAAALPGFHCLTGCDTCEHIKGTGKNTAFKAFTEATPAELTALSKLRIEEMPSADVFQAVRGFCTGFLALKRPKGQQSYKNWGGSA